MKAIKVPTSVEISAVNGPVTVSAGDYEELRKLINYNKSQIISGVLTIENELESIIAYFYFGNHKEGNKRKHFERQILASNWCSYSAKKSLILYILNEFNYLSGSEKQVYDKLLKKVMSYRNAFTHGNIMITAGKDENEVLLKFYEGGEQSVVLTDDYLSRIEKDIADCFELTMKVNKNSGATVEQTFK